MPDADRIPVLGAISTFTDEKESIMNQEEQLDKISQLYARSWSDEKFKQALLSNPAAVLKAEGMQMPEGVEVIALENTDTVFNLVLPALPLEGALSDTQLEDVSGGAIGVATLATIFVVALVKVGVVGLTIGLHFANRKRA